MLFINEKWKGVIKKMIRKPLNKGKIQKKVKESHKKRKISLATT